MSPRRLAHAALATWALLMLVEDVPGLVIRWVQMPDAAYWSPGYEALRGHALVAGLVRVVLGLALLLGARRLAARLVPAAHGHGRRTWLWAAAVPCAVGVLVRDLAHALPTWLYTEGYGEHFGAMLGAGWERTAALATYAANALAALSLLAFARRRMRGAAPAAQDAPTPVLSVAVWGAGLYILGFTVASFGYLLLREGARPGFLGDLPDRRLEYGFFAVQLALGVLLLRQAPWVAERLGGDRAREEGGTDAARLGAFVLGLVGLAACLEAVHLVARGVARAALGHEDLRGAMLLATGTLLVGLGALAGPSNLVRWARGLRPWFPAAGGPQGTRAELARAAGLGLAGWWCVHVLAMVAGWFGAYGAGGPTHMEGPDTAWAAVLLVGAGLVVAWARRGTEGANPFVPQARIALGWLVLSVSLPTAVRALDAWWRGALQAYPPAPAYHASAGSWGGLAALLLAGTLLLAWPRLGALLRRRAG